MSHDIGVGAGKFLGVQRIFARISPNLPQNFLCDFCLKSFPHKDHLWYDLQKKVFLCLYAKVWRLFSPDFQGFCPNFQVFFPDFARIFDKSKPLGVRLHSLRPRLLHH